MTSVAWWVLATEEGQERAADLPAPALVLGIGTFILFVLLMLITLQFNKD